MQFKKAQKTQVRLRLAMFGPAGAGKTYSALRLGTGMLRDGERMAVIDTEFGSSAMYADQFDFDMLVLEKPSIDMMVKAIQAAAQNGYTVLVIDSLSLSWQELLDEVDRLARAKYGGNTWSAWSEGTPKQRRMIRALLAYPGHIIATMRSKTEWSTTVENGKVRPVRVGLAPEQGKGIEYEFDMLMTISTSHEAHVIKDRTGKYQDQSFQVDEAFGQELREWLESGEAPPRAPASPGNGKHATLRPLAPDKLRELVARKADKYRERGFRFADSKKLAGARGIVATVLEETLGGKTQRHELLQWLIGHASLKDDGVDDAIVKALLDWLDATQDSGGKYEACHEAAEEARAAHQAALRAQGQAELLPREAVEEVAA